MRPRVGFNADKSERIVVIRYVGAIGGEHIVPEVLQQFRALEKAWEYDCIFDLRRHNGLVEIRDNEALAYGWLNIAGGRDVGRRTAVVSDDPLIDARLPIIQAMFPFRTLVLFPTVEAARDWLLSARHESIPDVFVA